MRNWPLSFALGNSGLAIWLVMRRVMEPALLLNSFCLILPFVLGSDDPATWLVIRRVMEPAKMLNHRPGDPIVPNEHAARSFAALLPNGVPSACYVLLQNLE